MGGRPDELPSLRIIGGTLRGRLFHYSGDPHTRPMKDRVRESVFNLVGTDVRGRHVVDLFAGTGALALEAISRGAEAATVVERHFPTAKLLAQNVEKLGVAGVTKIVTGSAFVWARKPSLPATGTPWLIFCSPPYAFYRERVDEMTSLLDDLAAKAPPRSVLVVEHDAGFDPADLPTRWIYDCRSYPPAMIAIGCEPASESTPTPA